MSLSEPSHPWAHLAWSQHAAATAYTITRPYQSAQRSHTARSGLWSVRSGRSRVTMSMTLLTVVVGRQVVSVAGGGIRTRAQEYQQRRGRGTAWVEHLRSDQAQTHLTDPHSTQLSRSRLSTAVGLAPGDLPGQQQPAAVAKSAEHSTIHILYSWQPYAAFACTSAALYHSPTQQAGHAGQFL